MTDLERARLWLAESGVRQIGPDTWRHEDEPGRTLAKNDVAVECSSWIFEDVDLDEDARIHVAFGLMDHDYFGKLEPEPALALLDRLALPGETEHLRPLRTVLAAGHTSHYAAPDAWTAARPPSTDEPQDL